MNGKHGPKKGWKKTGICNSLAGNREARVQSDKLGTFLTSVEIELGILRLGAEETGVTREDQQTASRQRQGPKASCVHSSLARSEPKRNARRDRAKDSRVGSWQSRGGGAGTRLRQGGRKSPWALGLPQDGGQRQEMEAREKEEQQSPGRGSSEPKGQEFNPKCCCYFPWSPKTHAPPP